VAFVTSGHALTVGSQTLADVDQIGFSPAGQLYYLTKTGSLFRGVGNSKGGYKFGLIDNTSSAFAVNNIGALVDIRSNGDVWELTGKAAKLPAVTNTKTSVAVWTKNFSGANVGVDVGSQQAGITTGTVLFTLSDGDFFFLVNNRLIQLSADRAVILATNQTDIDWEGAPNTNPGVSFNLPAFNAGLGSGTFFAALSGTGTPAFPLTLL
jgi:hypothetical protein